MTEGNQPQTPNANAKRSLIDLTSEEARTFLLKQESYCTIDLPSYFQFDNLLEDVTKLLEGKNLSDFIATSPKTVDEINHDILNNKDGKYAWRPLELIHPVLYVSLVNKITQSDHWEIICNRFKAFRKNTNITCMSLPVESLTDNSDKAEQVSQWWRDIEQKSLELSLDYETVVYADIVDCYGAIYTHSIASALHSKTKAKCERDDMQLIGNTIDSDIRNMRQGQTNGIPQGSVLMDFIAEMVLGYADSELALRITSHNLSEYRILRYRDDYRVFVKSAQDGAIILKCLTEVMNDLGLKLNTSKTYTSNEVVRSSIKADKLEWLFRKQKYRNLQKRLLIIHDHSTKFNNAGSLQRAMFSFYKRLCKLDKLRKHEQAIILISIVVDIAYRNPRTYPMSAAILSKLMSFVDSTTERQIIIERIRQKFLQLPNTGYMEIWLQRISYPFDSTVVFDEPLCQLLYETDRRIWNNEWLEWRELRSAMDSKKIVNREELTSIPSVVPIDEVTLFSWDYGN